jgi:hypothetical protein
MRTITNKDKNVIIPAIKLKVVTANQKIKKLKNEIWIFTHSSLHLTNCLRLIVLMVRKNFVSQIENGKQLD